MSSQGPVPIQNAVFRLLEHILHFPAIISPDFVFFGGENQLTAKHVRIGRALEALSLDDIPKVGTTWPPVTLNVSRILECYLIALPELRFRNNIPLLDFHSLGLILSHLQKQFGNNLVKDTNGSLLINEEVVAFVVIKYALDYPYMKYDFDTMNALFQADNNHPHHQDASIVHHFHRLIDIIRYVTRLRVRLINQFGRPPVIQPVAYIQDVRQAQRTVSSLNAFVSDLPVANNPVVNNPSINNPTVNTPVPGNDEINRVSSNVSYSFVTSFPSDTVPYKVYFPRKLLQDLYYQAFPSGHNTDDVEEEGYLTGVSQAIVKSIASQNTFKGPDFTELFTDTRDETLVRHGEWHFENRGNMENHFPPNYPEALRCLYDWGVSREPPRFIQLMLWEVGRGPGPMIQIHEEPTDYVWISCAPPDPENEWCYGAMLKKPTHDAEEANNAPPADIADAKVHMAESSNGAAVRVEPAGTIWERVSELARKIVDDQERNPDIAFSTEILELARGVLKYKAVPQNKPVHKLHSGDDDSGVAGPSSTGRGVEDGTHQKVTDTPDTRPRKRARANSH